MPTLQRSHSGRPAAFGTRAVAITKSLAKDRVENGETTCPVKPL